MTEHVSIRSRGLFLGLFGLLGLSVPALAQAQEQAANEDQAPYMRILEDDKALTLEIAARKFIPAQGKGPVVWLSGVIHIADPDLQVEPKGAPPDMVENAPKTPDSTKNGSAPLTIVWRPRDQIATDSLRSCFVISPWAVSQRCYWLAESKRPKSSFHPVPTS